MAYDYSKYVTKLINNVDKYGRDINILRTSITGIGIDQATTSFEVQTKCIAVGYKSTEINNTTIKAGDVMAIFGANEAIKYSDRIREIDNSKTYEIISLEEIKPANTLIGYKAQLRGV
ncbi:hypothetical protein [Francisella marina]|uniref:hypothetical protein n=1 Tax=Francisella marina TaxID=2249302 RepID=UPI0011EDD3D0|nr:hypothetical protein [Francisella marina]QEO58322.1 hypothetical protein F0R75_00495 [Francisella marina]